MKETSCEHENYQAKTSTYRVRQLRFRRAFNWNHRLRHVERLAGDQPLDAVGDNYNERNEPDAAPRDGVP
jgi:hypothetical protein